MVPGNKYQISGNAVRKQLSNFGDFALLTRNPATKTPAFFASLRASLRPSKNFL